MLPKWRFTPAAYAVDALNPEIALAPWAGHRQFAYDYIVNIRPNVVVELGTFHGCAFFSFCQAALDEGLDWTQLYAVDNWIGNEHDTFYGEGVFETFRKLCAVCFGSLRVHPVRKQFMDAAPDFADGSIDLLHIDGLHTYDAVRQDYETWLPKLADEGVVFLHDVFTERHGSTRLWREATLEHPSLLFEHSFGLGLLFPKGDKLYRHLVGQGLPQLAPLYERIGALETALARERTAHARESAAAAASQAACEASVAESRTQCRDLERQLRAAKTEAEANKAQADAWWQAAVDAQWRIDSLERRGS